MRSLSISDGTCERLGAHHDGGGVNFAVFSENATKIELCLFSPDGRRETSRLALPERSGSVWHGYVETLPVGTLYGYRVHGSYAPEAGHRFNPNKLLCDPYTRSYHGSWSSHPATFGYSPTSPDGDLSFSRSDSAPHVPKCVVSDPEVLRPVSRERQRRDDRDLIYEAHVKGLTQMHPRVPEALRGTYEGLVCTPVLEHLQALGVRAIELMPVHGFIDDEFLLDQGLRNYWGYNTIGYFVAEPRYFGPRGLMGFRYMVDRFHDAGIEVILDVVYNHTAEGDHRGPTLSFRGLDNASYYRLPAGQPRYYVNDTGCGNTVNIAHPYVLRMVLDSLRFWVEVMGIDGFRFDLATTLGREDHGFDPRGGFFDALRQDPVLARARMIAEPWDIGPGGYQLGEFPHEFSEWNDRYRDTVRRYWRGDAHSTQELGARLLGSADTFDRDGRRSWSSVNFVAAHDGFTLADATQFNDRHNAANLENNEDGHHGNFSDNCGVEGTTGNVQIQTMRTQRVRNMLATLFLSQGTPLILAGDEFGNSQNGNNNAYCQDNEISWLDWDGADAGLLEFVADLAAFRRAHASLRQTRFLHGTIRESDGLPDVEWMSFHGEPIQWRDPALSNFCLTIRCAAEAPSTRTDSDVVFAAFNRSDEDRKANLPPVSAGRAWVRAIDTDRSPQPDAATAEPESVLIRARSVAAFVIQTTPNTE